MRVPEEWPSRRGSDLPAIQNPAYRPAGTPLSGSDDPEWAGISRPIESAPASMRGPDPRSRQATLRSTWMLPRVASE